MFCPICGTGNMVIGSCRTDATDDCNIEVHFAICNFEQTENCPEYGNEICSLNIIRESNLLIREAIDKLLYEKRKTFSFSRPKIVTTRSLLKRIRKLEDLFEQLGE